MLIDPQAKPGVSGDVGSRCSSCRLIQNCLPRDLVETDVKQLEQIVLRRRPLEPRQHLWIAGDRFQSVVVVRTGAFKVYTLTKAGEEQISAFHLPGEFVGLDAIDSGIHPSAVMALETSSFCELPFEMLEALARRVPALQNRLISIMSGAITSDYDMCLCQAKCTAEERLAFALLDLSARMARQGLSPRRLRLPMTRAELGNYLGLVPETMSRLFKRFQRRGWVSAVGLEVMLQDTAALRRLASRHIDQTLMGQDAM